MRGKSAGFEGNLLVFVGERTLNHSHEEVRPKCFDRKETAANG